MAFIPGNTGTSAKAVDGLEGPTAGSPVVFPSGISGNFVPTALADANATLTSANSVVVMTPSANRVLTLPSSVPSAAFAITVINRSASFTIALNASGGGTVATVGLGEVTVLSTQTNPTTTGHWTISTNGAVLQGGNSFGATMLVGTNDNFGFNIETNGTVKVAVGTDGLTTLTRSGDTKQLKLERTGGGAGFGFIGGSSGSALTIYNQLEAIVGDCTQAGAWTLGPALTATTHVVNGNVVQQRSASLTALSYYRFGNSTVAQNSSIGQEGSVGGALITGSGAYGMSIVSGAGLFFSGNNGTLHGSLSTAGAWTLGAASSAATNLNVNGQVQVTSNASNSGQAISMTNTNNGAAACAVLNLQSDSGAAQFIKNSIANTGGAARALRIINESNGVYLAQGGTVWQALSDMRRKTKVADLGSVLAGLQSLQTFTYKFNNEDGTVGDGPVELGISAQEMLTVAPEIVNGSEDTTYSVAYDRLSVVLVKAIQELNAKIEAQAQEIQLLKGGN